MFSPKSVEYVKEKDEIVEKFIRGKNEKAERNKLQQSSMILLNKKIWMVLINQFIKFDWMRRIKVKILEYLN